MVQRWKHSAKCTFVWTCLRRRLWKDSLDTNNTWHLSRGLSGQRIGVIRSFSWKKCKSLKKIKEMLVFSLWNVIYSSSPPPPGHVSGLNHFLQKTFFLIWKSSESLMCQLNFMLVFANYLWISVFLIWLWSSRSREECITKARAAWRISSWMFVEWRHMCSRHCVGMRVEGSCLGNHRER